MKTEIVDGVAHQFPDDATDEEIAEALEAMHPPQPIGAAGGMGDVKLREFQMENPGPAPTIAQQFLNDPRSQIITGPLKFAGNVAQSLSTGPINAVAQAVQDKEGAGPVAWQAAKNVVKSTINPFIPGENPIQSSETSLERAGVPNTPREFNNMVPGFVMKSNALSGSYGLKPEDAGRFEDAQMYPIPVTTPGMAKEIGFAADIAPVSFAGVLAKTLSYIPRLAKTGIPSKAIDAAGTGLQKVGESQMNKVIKPLMRHERKARKPIEQVVFEQGLDKGKGGAGPKAIYKRSGERLNQLGAKLKAEIRAGRDAGARVNTDQLIDQAVADFKATAGESEDFYSMARDIDEIAADFKARAQAANGGKGELDLLQAHGFKKYAGHEGAWQQIAQSKGIPLSAKESARSKFAEDLYHRLNDAIDEGAPNGIKDLNRQISEIIPVNQAAGWRQIVEGRGNAVSLNDVIGMTATAINPKVWPIMAFNRATKSGTVASKIYRLGEAMKTGTPSPRAKSLWASLQKPLEETQKVKIAELLAAEIQAQGPANAIPFPPPRQKVAEEDQPVDYVTRR